MRIFHLAPNMNYGGLQEVVRCLALCQRKAGHDVTIGCWTNASNHPEAEGQLEAVGVRVVNLRRAADGALLYDRDTMYRGLKQNLAEQKTEILHIHNPFAYFLYGVMAARTAGRVKVINTMHATVMLEGKGFSRKSKAKFWASAMLTHGVVSVCQEVQNVIRSKYLLPKSKLIVVENGIDLTRFLSTPTRESTQEVIFGAVGRMSPEKNHRGLIEAFAMARRDHANIRLRLLGSGPLEGDLRTLAKNLGVAETVEFCGFSHDVSGFLSTVDVFVLPSNSEGLPLSLLEAIAAGLPVVATAVGGVPRVVSTTESGWVCEPCNPPALQKAMESAIACPDRGARSERARKLVVERYSAERMARDYDSFYERLLQ
jgi:glycosyltransferase involved in cell wall biosynthesis